MQHTITVELIRCCSSPLCSVLQVFVNTMYVGELDYNTVELSLPEGQVSGDCSQQQYVGNRTKTSKET